MTAFEKIVKQNYPEVYAGTWQIIQAVKPVNEISNLQKIRQLFGERAKKERHLFIAVALKYIYPNLYGAKTPFVRFEGFTGEVARLTGDHVSNTSKKIRDVLIWLHSNADDFRDIADREYNRLFDKCEPCPDF
ncbi:MAG: hypothetical protein BGN92_09835 [Sphingobacteriales bacterium 41-5]|nr:MAG: hypothetical protein BGN92_09835 [Sphingobacteriales bacterium 41-5]